MDPTDSKGNGHESHEHRDGRDTKAERTRDDEQQALNDDEGEGGDSPRVGRRTALRDSPGQADDEGCRERRREDAGNQDREQRGGRGPQARPRREVPEEIPNRGGGPAPRSVDDEEDRDAQQRGRRRDRAEYDHELVRAAPLPASDGRERRSGPAAESGEPGHRRAGRGPPQGAPRMRPRERAEGSESLMGDPTRRTSQRDDQRRESEESREKRKQDRVRVEGERSARGHDPQRGGEGLHPGRAEDPPDRMATSILGREDRSEEPEEEDGRPRAETLGQLERIAQEEPERDDHEDRERRPEHGAPGRQRDRLRPVPRQEQAMSRERGEGRILRRRAEEHAGDEVEHRVAGRGRDEEAGEQRPGQEGIGRRPGYQDREESDPGASSRQEQGGHVVDVESRRKSRDAADGDAEEDQDEESEDEDRDIHDGARQASGLNLVDARSLQVSAAASRRDPNRLHPVSRSRRGRRAEARTSLSPEVFVDACPSGGGSDPVDRPPRRRGLSAARLASRKEWRRSRPRQEIGGTSVPRPRPGIGRVPRCPG